MTKSARGHFIVSTLLKKVLGLADYEQDVTSAVEYEKIFEKN